MFAIGVISAAELHEFDEMCLVHEPTNKEVAETAETEHIEAATV
jgi:hypothetical protein